MEKNVAEVLEKMATQLGTTTEYLWKVLIHQAALAPWIWLFESSVVVLFSYLVYRFGKWSVKKATEDSDYEALFILVGIAVIAVVVLIFAVVVAGFSKNVITAILNPEFWALKEILTAVGK